MEGWLSGLGY